MKFQLCNQLEAADCGPACIKMIAAHYRKNISLSLLKEYCNVTRLGISSKDVVDGCEKIGMTGRVFHLSIEKVRQMPLPAILYWRQGHYVVLYEVKKRKGEYTYSIADPGFGKVKLNEQELLQDWSTDGETGIVILVEPTDEFYKLENEKYHTKLSTIFEPFKH